MSRKIYYNKLIRDRMKEHIEAQGEHCEVRVIESDDEFQQELFKKVNEEAGAVSLVHSREEFLKEYADLMVVLDTLTETLEISEADIKTAIEKNIEKKGKFDSRHFLHWSDDSDYKSNETPQGFGS